MINLVLLLQRWAAKRENLKPLNAEIFTGTGRANAEGDGGKLIYWIIYSKRNHDRLLPTRCSMPTFSQKKRSNFEY